MLGVDLLWVLGLELHIWLFGVYLMLFWILYCSCFMSSNSPPAIYVANTLVEYLLGNFLGEEHCGPWKLKPGQRTKRDDKANIRLSRAPIESPN